MLAKIISAGALTLLLTGGALAYQPSHNIYAGHSNSAQPQMQTQQSSSNDCKQGGPSWHLQGGACPAVAGATANAAPYGYDDTQGSHALGGGPG
jgi:hypothetical protein